VRYVNPGSASRSRGGGHTVGLLELAQGSAPEFRVVELA
jgi:hypothetical protein